MKNKVLKWELFGIVFIFLAGALVHFVFEWSGGLKIVGAIAPVNESVWEHFKLGFLPLYLYAAVEYVFLRSQIKNFLIAKTLALYVIPVITVLLFYGYTAVVGKEILAVDIGIFALAVAMAQLAGYRVLTLKPLPGYLTGLSIVLILVFTFIMVFFTYHPPHLPIFQDHNTGVYGLP